MDELNEDELRQAIYDLQEEVEEWKGKYKALELKKREGDLSLNKIKAEVNSLRSVDRLWKDSAKAVYLNLTDIKNQFDIQADVIMSGLEGITKSGERVSSKIPYTRKLKAVIAAMQKRIANQEENIMSLNSRIHVLTVELEDKTDKVNRLSQGIEEEVERLMKPMRAKLADSMLMIMKEKAGRAQELRELADLWPSSSAVPLPTTLMKYRSLTKEEQSRRIQQVNERAASYALSQEIRANCVESRSWQLKYDDYGRTFYEHIRTGETKWEPPEILSYKPPPGRDEMGNVIDPDGGDQSTADNWSLQSDHKGEVSYRHKKTGEVSYTSPTAYPTIPKGKTKELIASESAQIVLSFIKEKISKHISMKRKQQWDLEHPLTPEDRKKKAKEEKNKTAEQRAVEAMEIEATAQEDAAEPMDLRMYQYDIETVEMLAAVVGEKVSADDDPSTIRRSKREFLQDNHVRSFDPEYYIGKTLVELDLNSTSVEEVRAILEEYATFEEKLDKQLVRVRENLKDFTFVLMEKQVAADKKKAEELSAELKRREEEERVRIEAELQQQKELETLERKAAEKQLAEKEMLKLQQQQQQQQQQNSNEEEAVSSSTGDKMIGEDDHLGMEEENSVSAVEEQEESVVEDENRAVERMNPFLRRQKTLKRKRNTIIAPDGVMDNDVSDDEADERPEEDEDEEDDDDDDQKKKSYRGGGEADADKYTQFSNFASLLLGAPPLVDSEPDFSPEMLELSTNLSNFALFCGYANIHINESPNESTIDYSLSLDNNDGNRYKGSRSRSRSNSKRNTASNDYEKEENDDEWLSSAFFLTCSKNTLDDIRHHANDAYNAMIGFMPLSNVDSEAIVFKLDENRSVERPMDKPYTASTGEVDDFHKMKYQLWKTKQLMSDVLRHQIQREAVNIAYRNRFKAFTTSSDDIHHHHHLQHRQQQKHQSLSKVAAAPAGIPMIRLVVKEIAYNPTMAFKSVLPNLFYLQIQLGKCMFVTDKLNPSPNRPLQWSKNNLRTMTGFVPVNDIQLLDFQVELLDENPILEDNDTQQLQQQLASVGRGFITIENALGVNMGREMHYEVSIYDNNNNHHQQLSLQSEGEKKIKVGSVSITLTLDTDKAVSELSADPINLETFEINVKKPSVVQIDMTLDTTDERSKNTDQSTEYTDYSTNDQLVDQSSGSERIVGATVIQPSKTVLVTHTRSNGNNVLKDNSSQSNSIRAQAGLNASSDAGDRVHSLRSLVSDLRGDGVDFIRLLTANVSIEDLQRINTEISGKVTQNIPNFDRIALFLEKKIIRHRWEIERLNAEIVEFYGSLNETLTRRMETMSKLSNDLKLKYMKHYNQSESIKADVLKRQQTVSDLKKLAPEPKAPVFPPLGFVSYIVKVPASGGLDSRGKKKKKLTKEEMQSFVDQVDSGKLDGLEVWIFPDQKFPDQAQSLKLSKAVQARNAVLDSKRKDEEERRNRLTEGYQQEMQKWRAQDSRRLKDLEKAKKECRKINMRYDCFMNIVTCHQQDHQTSELDLKIMADLKVLHSKAKQRFAMMRFKQSMEFNRQQTYLADQKKRLLKALKARRFALDLPATATDDLEYADLCRQAEAALRVIRFEIFECKHTLISEGSRLRTLFKEEFNICTNELARLKVAKEIMAQRDCYYKILERYKYEVVHLYIELEKHKLREIEPDEVGIDTVDNLGERYKSDKRWLSTNVINCQRVIDICVAKINLTEGLGTSTGYSQRVLLDVTAIKWGADFLPVRDNWSEVANYERAQELLEDTVQWAQRERRQLQNIQNKHEREKLGLALQLDALRSQLSSAASHHEIETKVVTDGSNTVIEVIKGQLITVREEAKAKIMELDHSIVNLSRECESVREELLAQAFMFEDKMKVLWAFIHTMQTAVQQIAAKMELVIEERDKVVIESKLVAERMRAQLRIERKHCSNLLFLIQSQRGNVRFLKNVILKLSAEHKAFENQHANEKTALRKEIYEQIFTFTRLSTDVDALFEFFTARLANLAGARKIVNDQLSKNGAAQVLAALCKSPRPLIRKFASRAIGAMGWDGFIETRILLWDATMYWKIYKSRVISEEAKEYQSGLNRFKETGKIESIVSLTGEVDEFVPTGNMSLRTIIKQRRQWALRAAKRREGPNISNQRQINVRDGVVTSLLQMCLTDGAVDWEIPRNAALAVSIASNEQQNHIEVTQSQFCIDMIVAMCKSTDAEVQTHAAVTIANLCHSDENSQLVFGRAGAIEPLLKLCRCPVVDVLEASTSALSNLTSYCDVNCSKVLELDGVDIIVHVITNAYSENLLDLDQNDEVQANAAELLANISRFSLDSTVIHFKGRIIDALIVLCSSKNVMVRKHIPLVLGNISQVESCRQEIGMKGGVEALFLALEDDDKSIQANVLWSLCNLMWHPPNQERAGRFITEVLSALQSPWDPVRIQAMTLLANLLYYNNDNRIRFLESEGAFEKIIDFVKRRIEVSVVEGSLRALLSLSYIDNIALWLGTTGQMIPVFISYLSTTSSIVTSHNQSSLNSAHSSTSPVLYSRDSMRYSLEILCNLCLHNANRQIIFDSGGVDAIVALHIESDVYVRDLSIKVIEYLSDITPPEVLARTKQLMGLDRMVKLATSDDPLVRAVAAESIGEELWHDPSKQSRTIEVGGLDALLAIAANPNEPVESLLPAIWSLRNLMHDQSTIKSQFAYRDGISVMNSVLREVFSGKYEEQTEKLLEAVLLCFITATLNEERISRRLLNIALPRVIDLAEGTITTMIIDDDYNNDRNGEDRRVNKMLSSSPNPSKRPSPQLPIGSFFVKSAMQGESIKALAKSLLLQLAPFNYVVCRNCSRKQDLHGQSCYNCGSRLLVEVDMVEIKGRVKSSSTTATAAADKRVQKVQQPFVPTGPLDAVKDPPLSLSKGESIHKGDYKTGKKRFSGGL